MRGVALALGLGVLVALVASPPAGAVDLYANGKRIVASPGIVVVDGVSYGPLRAVAEALGGEVQWYEAEQRAVVCAGGVCVPVEASEGIRRNDRLLLPIRRLGEAVGGTVVWDGAAQAIYITMAGG